MVQRNRLGNSGTVLVILALCAASWATDKSTAAKADRVVIVKNTRTLTLLNHGQVLKTYQVALGGDPVGPKAKAGDNKTPEGEYIIDSKKPHSRFHLALHISYPNAADRERARKLGVSPGGDVEIHGLEAKYAWVGSLHRQVNWTAGCIAVTNPEIEEIYKLVPVGTPVEIQGDEKPVEHSETVDPKNGNLHLQIPVRAAVKPKPQAP
jgi:murein L,D-transpeptidase YafK